MKNNGYKKQILIIVLLLFVAIIVFFIIAYTSRGKIKVNNSSLSYHSGKIYKIYDGTLDEKTDTNETISFEYPIINIKSTSINKVNKEIKEKYENVEKIITNFTDINDSDENYICWKNNVDYHCSTDVVGIDYEMHEDYKYLQLNIYEYGGKYNGGGYRKYNLYTISKNDKKVLTSKDILKIFDYSPKMLYLKAKNYIVETRTFDGSYEDSELMEDDLTYSILNDKLLIAFEWNSYSGTEFIVYNGELFEEIDIDEYNKYFAK